MKFYVIMRYTQSGELVPVTKKNYVGYPNAQMAAVYGARRKEGVRVILSVEKDSNGFPVVKHETTITWEGIHYSPSDPETLPSYATLTPPPKEKEE